MIWVDFIILGILVISTVISLFRGFVKEIFSLAAWILAFWVAIRFAHPVSDAVFGSVEVPSARLALGYISLFLATLIAGSILAHLMTLLVKHTQLSGTDRTLGMIFGALRGVIIVMLLIIVAQMTPLDEDPWWQESYLIHHFERLAQWTLDQLPEEMAEHFRQIEAGIEQLPDPS